MMAWRWNHFSTTLPSQFKVKLAGAIAAAVMSLSFLKKTTISSSQVVSRIFLGLAQFVFEKTI
jgi:hypothetical protein